VTTIASEVAAGEPVDDDRIARVAAALRSHNIEAIVVETGADARRAVLGLIPKGAEVHSGKSKSLEDVGLFAELVESGRYDAIRPRIFKMDRQTQGREIPAPRRSAPVIREHWCDPAVHERAARARPAASGFTEMLLPAVFRPIAEQTTRLPDGQQGLAPDELPAQPNVWEHRLHELG